MPRIRLVFAAIGLVLPVFFLTLMFVLSLDWWLAFCDAVVIWAFAKEWRYIVHAEDGRPYMGVSLPKTTWWNYAGYYVMSGFMCFGFFGSATWHLSDMTMAIVFLFFAVVLGVWVAVRIRLMPKLPRRPPSLFLRSPRNDSHGGGT